jgi:cytochrome c peroxidase
LAALPASLQRLVARRAMNPPGDAGAHDSADPDVAALGRFAITLVPGDVGLFRTPSLRGVSRAAPYMHDGSVAALADAVDRESYRVVDGIRRPIPLTAEQRADLVAFLGGL